MTQRALVNACSMRAVSEMTTMPISFTCPHCGHQTLVADEYVGTTGPCSVCHKAITITGEAPVTTDFAEDATTRMLLPVGRSVWAIAAGYVGIFAIFCFVPGPIALILGVVAIRDIKAHPDRHGMGRAIFGIVAGILGTIGLVVILIASALNA